MMQAMNNPSLLIADIGGTNARFALASNDNVGFTEAKTLNCDDFSTPVDAIRQYLDSVSDTELGAVCLAAAGPVIDDTISLTNNHWVLSAKELRSELGVADVRLLNDFEAIAHSIPHIEENYLESVGQASQQLLPDDSFKIAIVGPGTGLGAGGLYKQDGRVIPIVGEGGNIGFAPKSKTQIEILEVLRDKYERVYAESLLSGTGIENIYWALNKLRGEDRAHMSAADIFVAASSGTDPAAADATQLFYEVLGQFAGDIALTLGATEGLYLAGGIVKRYPEMLHISGFRNAFEAKGRYRYMMERIPTRLITYDEPGLLGAASCIKESGR